MHATGIGQHIVHVLVYALAVLLAARIVPGIKVRSFWSAVVFAIVFAILDKLLFTLLVFLSLPFVLITFGLFVLVINAFLFWLADKLVDGVEVDGPLSAFLGALVTSIVNMLVLWVAGA